MSHPDWTQLLHAASELSGACRCWWNDGVTHRDCAVKVVQLSNPDPKITAQRQLWVYREAAVLKKLSHVAAVVHLQDEVMYADGCAYMVLK